MANEANQGLIHSRPIQALAVLLTLVVVGALLWHTLVSPTRIQIPTSLIQSVRAGDMQAAFQTYQQIVNDPAATPDEKALAVSNAVGVRYRLSGNVDDLLKDVQDLKKIVLETDISMGVRVGAINGLASIYGDYGRKKVVFDEIYKDDPFHQYLVPNDPDLSARHLFEWSYSLAPSSVAAISVASWYSGQKWYSTTALSTTTLATYEDMAEQYLKKADAIAQKEISNDPSFISGNRYLYYSYERVSVIGRLANLKGDPYTSEYSSEYQKFFTIAQSQQSAGATIYLHYARLYFAENALTDSATKKTQLDLLASELQALQNPSKDPFVQDIQGMYAARNPDSSGKSTNPDWRTIRAMMKISPNFASAINGFIGKSAATTPASTTTTQPNAQ